MHVRFSIPENIPVSVAQELASAADRTGWTDPLRKAAERLPYLFQLQPAEFEAAFAGLYRELP